MSTRRVRQAARVVFTAIGLAILIVLWCQIGTLHCVALEGWFRPNLWHIHTKVGLFGVSVLFLALYLRPKPEHAWVSHYVLDRRRQLSEQTHVEYWFARLRFYMNRVKGVLAEPSLLGFAAVTTALSIPFLLWFLNPCAAASESAPSDQFLAVWQVQFALAAAAIPILIFVIQRNLEVDLPSGLPAAEVLLTDTYVFLIFVAVVTVVIVMTFSLLLGRAADVEAWATWGFLTTLVLTAIAYARLLELLSRISVLEDKSRELLVRRFRRALEETTDMRIGANLMRRWVEARGAEYSMITGDSLRYISLKAAHPGVIEDVHLGRLWEFLEELPWKGGNMDQAHTGELIPDTPRTGSGSTVVFARLYGEQLYPDRRDLVLIRRDMLQYVETATLERRLLRAYKIRKP